MKPRRLFSSTAGGALIAVELSGGGGCWAIRFSGHERLRPDERRAAELELLPVAVRHARTHGRDALKKLSGVSKDDVQHAEKDLQKLHDDYIKKIDDMIKAKEAEIMEV